MPTAGGGGTVSTCTGGGATLMSKTTPAEAIVGKAAAPAAIMNPNSNALREPFIPNSFLI
jgi:hypothetical protein